MWQAACSVVYLVLWHIRLQIDQQVSQPWWTSSQVVKIVIVAISSAVG
jgi:hypothetical protein